VAWREAVVVNVAPEFDDCARLAEQHGVPVKEVHADAAKAYQDIGGTGRSPV
jgi:uncharacterized protein (DUF111 family)